MDTSTWLLERSTAPRHESRRLTSLHHPAARTLALADGEAWSIDSSRAGLTVRCITGKLWITVEGDPEDHLVAAPDVFQVTTRGRVAVMALAPSTVELGTLPHLRS